MYFNLLAGVTHDDFSNILQQWCHVPTEMKRLLVFFLRTNPHKHDHINIDSVCLLISYVFSLCDWNDEVSSSECALI